MTLPRFTYHPDPVQTGSFAVSLDPCVCCGEARGYIYTGPVYALSDLRNKICPWCIADGSAHRKFDAEFASFGEGTRDKVSDAVRDEITHRTPGFSSWQGEQWWTHCGDAAEFLGPVGYREAVALGAQLLDALDCGYVGEWREQYLKSLDRDHGPTGYAFRCRHCGALGGYSDDH
jgi:uncharacterized protein